jgi:hypothetical protein
VEAATYVKNLRSSNSWLKTTDQQNHPSGLRRTFR